MDPPLRMIAALAAALLLAWSVAGLALGARRRLAGARLRRQLLEYWVGYGDTEGVLLVDMEQGRVMKIAFQA